MKLLLAVFILIIALPLYAQKPIIKFYLNDGSQPKEYNIKDIAQIDFIKTNLSYAMEIFKNGSINTYNVKDINSIEFIDSTQIKINLSNSSEIFSIAAIDSIIFIPNTCTEIVIGTQTWICKNLNVDHYRNGDSIPEVKDSTQWANLTTGAWCYCNNDSANGTIYGKLYNWYAVNDPRGLAPEGWHIPSDAEWTTLSTFLGGENVAGGKLKETGTTHWINPNTGATNETGFSALPGGYRDSIGAFSAVGIFGDWWSSTDYGTTEAGNRYLYCISSNLYILSLNKYYGLSVRCVKD